MCNTELPRSERNILLFLEMGDRDSSLIDSFQLIRFPSEEIHSVKSSLYASIVNVINCIVGAGILTLPHAISRMGIGLGYIMMFTFACKKKISV